MVTLRLVMFVLMGNIGFVFAQSKVLPVFKSAQNKCDYLIVTPEKYLPAAEKLATYRQTASGYKAAITLVDSLYSQFDSSGRKPFEKIWHGLKYAYTSWQTPPQFVVFFGSDSVSVSPVDSSWKNCGDMPVVVYGYSIRSTFPSLNIRKPYHSADAPSRVEYQYSDDYYAALKDSIPSIDAHFPQWRADNEITIGRIPCATNEQAEWYVQKVIDFETNRRLNKTWYNNALVVSDDTVQMDISDPLGYDHLTNAEQCANKQLKSSFVSKIISYTFPMDNNLFKPRAEDSIVSALNRGQLWTVFFGHGNPYVWTDERILTYNDAQRLNNDSMPTIALAFSCGNGDYLQPMDSSMCKRFLFRQHGGAVAWIAATTDSYSDDNKHLMENLFDSLNVNQTAPLGRILTKAKKNVGVWNSKQYAFLGDPALTVSDGVMKLSLARSSDAKTLSIACAIGNAPVSHGTFDIRVFKRSVVILNDGNYTVDSLISRQTGAFTNGQFTAPLRDSTARVVVFAWNADAEGRMDSSFTVAALPIIAKARQKPAAVTLHVDKGNLFIHAAALRGTQVRLMALTLSGKVVADKTIPANAPEMSISFKQLGLSAGCYFLRCGTVKGLFTQRVIVEK